MRARILIAAAAFVTAACGRLHYRFLPENAEVDAGTTPDTAAPRDTTPSPDADPGAGITTTYAGTGAEGRADGDRLQATFFHPFDLLIAPEGIYVADADNHAIRLVRPSGQVETLFGNAGQGFADGTAAEAKLNHPVALARDLQGRLLIVDDNNHAIRRVDADGSLRTIIGTGTAGANNGPMAQATLNHPRDLLVDADGSMIIDDKSNGLLRQVSADGQVSTLCGAALDLKVVDGLCGADARIGFSTGIERDGAGNLWLAEWSNHLLRRIDKTGRLTTVAGADGMRGYADGPGVTARLSHPVDLVFDAKRGGLWFFDHGSGHRLRFIKDDVVSTVFGPRTADDVQPDFRDGADPRFAYVEGFDLGSDGCIYAADLGNSRIRRACPP